MESFGYASGMTSNPFSEALSRFRDLAGLTQKQLAQKTHMAHSSINRWEKGGSLPKRDRVEALDKALELNGKLIASWRAARGGNGLPEWARDLDAIERAARCVTLVSPSLVPGMLQCRSYARKVFRAGQPLATKEHLDQLVALRCERLEELPDLLVKTVFPAAAVAGLPEPDRRDQASHLLNWVATERVTMHLIPEGTVMLAPTSPLMVYSMRENEIVVASDHALGTVIHADAHNRAEVFSSAALGAALPPSLSIDLLESLT